jgi:hypothetical protein
MEQTVCCLLSFHTPGARSGNGVQHVGNDYCHPTRRRRQVLESLHGRRLVGSHSEDVAGLPLPYAQVSEPIMNLTDATSTLLLAAKIHGADWAVKVTANRRPRSLACSKRAAIYVVMDHRGTMKFIARLTGHLD